jgi:hypothetical protein
VATNRVGDRCERIHRDDGVDALRERRARAEERAETTATPSSLGGPRTIAVHRERFTRGSAHRWFDAIVCFTERSSRIEEISD